MATPVNMEMDRNGPLAQHPNLLVKQTRKGCLQEMLGCEAKTEFRIATLEQKDNDIFYAIEESSCCIRFLCAPIRAFDMTVSTGSAAGGPQIAEYHRPCRCQNGPCKCCCFQEIISKANGKDLGAVTEKMYCCVPNFDVTNGAGTVEYKISPPTCCGGLCVDCCAEGCCKCRFPFYIYSPTETSFSKENKVGSITKIWGGLAKELLTDADTFETTFPADANPDTKLNILGGVFLINQLYFETSKQG